MNKNCIFHQGSSQKSFSIDFMRNMCTYTTYSGIKSPFSGKREDTTALHNYQC